MPLILHQALKDARLLRWLLAAWGLLLVAVHVVEFVVLRAQSIDQDTLSRLSTFETWFVILATAVFVVTAVLLVQHDSPVRPTAFWLTRPVPARTMLASKLLFALVVLAAVPLLLDAADFLFAGVSLRWWSPYAVAFQLAWLLPIMAIAAVTVDLPQFLLIAVFEIVLCAGVMSAAFTLGLVRPLAPWVVLSIGMPLVGAALLIYLYLTRHVRSSGALFVLAPILLAAAMGLAPSRTDMEWPWGDLNDYPEARQAGISVAADASSLTLTQPPGARAIITAPVTISGLPPDRLVFVSSQGWYETGSERIPLRVSLSESKAADVEADVARLMKNVLRGTTLLNPTRLTYSASRSSIGMSMSSADFNRVKDRVGRLHADLMLGVFRFQTHVVLPLKAGATFDAPAVRAEVLAVRPADVSVAVATRYTASGWFGPSLYSNVYLIRSQHLGQAVLGSPDQRRFFGSNFSTANITRMLMPVPLHVSVTWSALEFNFIQASAKSSRAAEWLQDGELVVASRASAGRWRATLDLPDIRLSQMEGAGPSR